MPRASHSTESSLRVQGTALRRRWQPGSRRVISACALIGQAYPSEHLACVRDGAHRHILPHRRDSRTAAEIEVLGADLLDA